MVTQMIGIDSRPLLNLAASLLLSALAQIPATACADPLELPYWQQSFPQLREPPADDRPKVRSRPEQSNLEALAQAGFGSVELGVDFRATPQVAQRQLHTLLEGAARLGIHVDLAPGGSQPYASPGISEAGSMQQLIAQHIAVQGGLDYAAPIRQPEGLAGHARLVAVTAARVTDDAHTPVILDADSAVDLTRRLDRSGVLHWHVPSGRWLLFSFWQRATGQIMLGNPFEAPNVWSSRVPHSAPGQFFTADIFSGTGIRSALAYLDSNILPGNAQLLRGGDFAHDSLEVQSEMFWTGDLPQQFMARRGYSMIRFLPALYTPREASFNPLDPAWGGALPPRPFEFSADVGRRVRYDYRRTLSDLYGQRYLAALSQWAHARGLRSRVQVAYNYFALDVLSSARQVDIPENESFDPGWSMPFDSTIPPYGSPRWRHVIDSYRLTGSGAHLAGHTRASIEFGDDFAIYRKQPIDYAQQLNESLAGGITMGLLTAFAGTNEAWPLPQGLAAIGLGDDWTSAWPQWRDWRALARYFARSTQVLESGQPRVDVAIYHDRGLATVHDSAPLFASDKLEGAGYSYDFIDPQALTVPEASSTPGMLYGPRVGYRALILDNEPSMPAAAARAILAMARRGLRVVVVGAPASSSAGFRDSVGQDRAVSSAMASLMSLPAVAQVESEDQVASALQRLGCPPDASFGRQSALLSVHRRSAGHELWWLFNPTDASISTNASFAAAGSPYMLDLWSGTGNRIAQWSLAQGRTVLPLVLLPHASMAILIHQREAATLHVVASTAGQIIQDGQDLIVITGTQGGEPHLVLSDGHTRDLNLSALPQALDLPQWNLQVHELLPDGARDQDLGRLPLADWRTIAQLQDSVGQALYSTAIQLAPDWFGSDRDVLLRVGEVAGAMQLSVNGHAVTEQTTGYGQWLVGAWLKPGDNLITIRLDTTLLNRMAALRATGAAPYQTGPTPLPTAPSGLIGPVSLISVARLPLARAVNAPP